MVTRVSRVSATAARRALVKRAATASAVTGSGVLRGRQTGEDLI
jgi:hypothetical protein